MSIKDCQLLMEYQLKQIIMQMICNKKWAYIHVLFCDRKVDFEKWSLNENHYGEDEVLQICSLLAPPICHHSAKFASLWYLN